MDRWCLGVAITLAAVGCHGRVEPLLCVTDDASLLVDDEDIEERRARCDTLTPTFEEGDVVHVLHQTAPEIALEGELEIVLVTPCGDTRTTTRPAGGIARASILLPAGGSCFLGVETTAAGTVLRRDYSGDCGDVSRHCSEISPSDGGAPVDSGADGAPTDDGG